ncbi:hypothetical protein Snoj_49770 [Streptomyces nojiriensis]|uniref:Uncharacterized protein n=1 Tax=Streptomyces nojiriensis TaxID=66374 RepID=A0ABQ3SSF0_9ACTN|nr:hypothetical protein GCM10010205_37160 [Streptomyces nojiriensis]GHI71059.1 hypothetical protein Snoj_49770 [Streptomyces nojiriensis]
MNHSTDTPDELPCRQPVEGEGRSRCHPRCGQLKTLAGYALRGAAYALGASLTGLSVSELMEWLKGKL